MNIDWKIPAVSIVSAAVAILVCLWVLAHRDATIDDHERRLVKVEATVDSQAGKLSTMNETLGRIDERVLLLLRMNSNNAHVKP